MLENVCCFKDCTSRLRNSSLEVHIRTIEELMIFMTLLSLQKVTIAYYCQVHEIQESVKDICKKIQESHPISIAESVLAVYQ